MKAQKAIILLALVASAVTKENDDLEAVEGHLRGYGTGFRGYAHSVYSHGHSHQAGYGHVPVSYGRRHAYPPAHAHGRVYGPIIRGISVTYGGLGYGGNGLLHGHGHHKVHHVPGGHGYGHGYHGSYGASHHVREHASSYGVVKHPYQHVY